MAQGAAAGASAGAPFGPWGVAIGAVAGAAFGAADDAMADGKKPMGDAGQNSAAQMGSDFVFDNSGWNINFGSGSIDARGDKTTSTGSKSASATQTQGDRRSDQGEPINPNLIYAGLGAAGFLVSLWIVKRKKKK